MEKIAMMPRLKNIAPCPGCFFSLGREKFFLGQGEMKVVRGG